VKDINWTAIDDEMRIQREQELRELRKVDTQKAEGES